MPRRWNRSSTAKRPEFGYSIVLYEGRTTCELALDIGYEEPALGHQAPNLAFTHRQEKPLRLLPRVPEPIKLYQAAYRRYVLGARFRYPNSLGYSHVLSLGTPHIKRGGTGVFPSANRLGLKELMSTDVLPSMIRSASNFPTIGPTANP